MQQVSSSSRASLAAMLASVLVILTFLAVLGGYPADQFPAFALGLLVVIAFTVGFAVAGWHLIFRPLPANYKISSTSPLSAAQRQLAGLALFGSLVFISIGGIWDEIWHSKYGIQFGLDFFWRPHIMMYAGFLAIIILGVYCWVMILRRGSGTLQQRFRADPIVGLVALFGAFMIYALPADPVWHAIYGEDITPWSIPHVTIIMIWVTSAVLASGLQMSVLPKRNWGSFLRLRLPDGVVLVSAACVLLTILVMFSVLWELYTLNGTDGQEILGWPVWLYPVFVTFTAGFMGIFANRATRRYGSATLAGIIALAIRMLLVYAIDGPLKGGNPWLISLPVLLAIDLGFFVWTQFRGREPGVLVMALWTVAGAALGMLPMMAARYIFPPINLQTLPEIVIAVMIAALVANWLVQPIGNFVASLQGRAAED
ncbi:MAG: hypothetical protein KC496_09330, partial [Anaerolineae bacterium]|nr:hypothetical protein [Anaerolineae bacterium]